MSGRQELAPATSEKRRRAHVRSPGSSDDASRADRLPRAIGLHVILDNVSTHKPAVPSWLERHPRITFFYFTPTSASWLNQIETWFSVLTRQAIRRGSFRSVKELITLIDTFTRNWNAGASPFTWVKTADQILAKAVRKPRASSESGH